MIDKKVIGQKTEPFTVDVERGRLRMFADAIGETDPVYSDAEAAQKAGHRDVLVPPTFLFCLEMEGPSGSFGLITELGINIGQILHGEEEFTYHALAYAGDRLTYSSEVTDTYSKKGGALDFIVRTTHVTRDGAPVADLRNIIVVRNS